MSKRRFAVILFADIAGYTALMQQDESLAKGQLQAFREAMQKQVAAHQGEIVHFYGDGCLTLFNLPRDAAQAAIQLQQSFQAAEIPVRIGIHSGTVNVDDDHVYGDAINVASRVESMSVPGAVLLSKKVRDELKNQNQFQLQNLGSFAFKNVEEPMGVFALANEGFAVPSPTQMAGKGKLMPSSPKRDATLGQSLLRITFGLILGGLLLWAGLYLHDKFTHSETSSPASHDKSIAVLPFRNMSDEPDQEFFSDGISEDILTHLARIDDLKVIARTSAFSFKGTDKSLVQIAHELGVAHILEGSVRRDKEKVRISTQLVHAETGALLWAEVFDRKMEDIFTVQQEVAQEISRKLNAELSAEEARALNQSRAHNPEAYVLLLKARQILANRNINQVEHARELLEDAIALDTNYADAYAELSGYYLTQGTASGDLSREMAMEKARPFLEKALSLDPENGNAYANLGVEKLWMNWDLVGAEIAFSKAKEYEVDDWFIRVFIFLYTGQLEKAEADMKEMRVLSPLNPHLDVMSGTIYFYQDSYQEAERILNQALALNPFEYDGYKFLAKSAMAQGKFAEAIQILEGGIKSMDNRFPYLLGELAVAYFKTGQADKTAAIIEEIRQNWETSKNGSPAFFLGLIYANMGEIDTAFVWLEKAYQDHEVEMLWLKMDPLARPLHGDPRYQDLLDRVGFP